MAQSRFEAYDKSRHLPRLHLNGSFSINDRNLGLEHPAGAGLSADAEGWSGPFAGSWGRERAGPLGLRFRGAGEGHSLAAGG